MKNFGEVVGGLLVWAGLITAGWYAWYYLASPHTQNAGFFQNAPIPGYVWKDSGNAADKRFFWQSAAVVWAPGLADPEHPHVVSGQQEGKWYPEVGYAWVDVSSASFAVHWVPKTERPDIAHVYASNEEGYWLAMPGYRFEASANAPGYEMASNQDLAMENNRPPVWVPGLNHPVCDCIMTSQTEGSWQPKYGYEFIPGSKLAVRHTVTPQTADSGSPDILPEVLIGAPACYAAAMNEHQGIWDNIKGMIEEKVCESAIESGVNKYSGSSGDSTPSSSENIPCDYWSLNWNHTPLKHPPYISKTILPSGGNHHTQDSKLRDIWSERIRRNPVKSVMLWEVWVPNS